MDAYVRFLAAAMLTVMVPMLAALVFAIVRDIWRDR